MSLFDISLSLVSKLDLRNTITVEFDSKNKYILVCKARTPHHVNINREFAHIIPDFIFHNFGNNIYYMGQATDRKSATYAIKNEPIILTKEEAENKLISLLEDGHEIITNPCMKLSDAKFYISTGALKLV
jgi:hypothetical protein